MGGIKCRCHVLSGGGLGDEVGDGEDVVIFDVVGGDGYLVAGEDESAELGECNGGERDVDVSADAVEFFGVVIALGGEHGTGRFILVVVGWETFVGVCEELG